MAYTKKHYELLARAVREASLSFDHKRYMAESIARVMKEDNPAFKIDVFLRACDLIP